MGPVKTVATVDDCESVKPLRFLSDCQLLPLTPVELLHSNQSRKKVQKRKISYRNLEGQKSIPAFDVCKSIQYAFIFYRVSKTENISSYQTAIIVFKISLREIVWKFWEFMDPKSSSWVIWWFAAFDGFGHNFELVNNSRMSLMWRTVWPKCVLLFAIKSKIFDWLLKL